MLTLAGGVARNLIWGVYVLTSHCNFKTCVNVPHVNKTVTDLGVYIPIYPPPVATPLNLANNKIQNVMHETAVNLRVITLLFFETRISAFCLLFAKHHRTRDSTAWTALKLQLLTLFSF